ncbi:DUF3231 family protein [Paenibacillus sp. TRM 82003]|nr:DUF3231 family protein [Paenibacillus sp. TRM 82003]
MVNILESVSGALKTLTDDEPKHPLHVGEVMSLWFYLTALEEMLNVEAVGKNTTVDDELKELLKEALEICNSQAARIKNFMISEGIPLPPLSEQKPESEPNAIPLGAKFTDDEIANMISIKVAGAVVQCATGMAQSIRNDVGMLWGGLMTEYIPFGTKLKTKMRYRGWIKVPPYYYPPGSPVEG